MQRFAKQLLRCICQKSTSRLPAPSPKAPSSEPQVVQALTGASPECASPTRAESIENPLAFAALLRLGNRAFTTSLDELEAAS